MKKIFLNLVTGAIFAALITGCATAQDLTDYSFSADSKTSNTANIGEEKRTVTNIISEPAKTKAELKAMKENLKAAKANAKATNYFDKRFKAASDVKWVTENQMIIASFSNENNRSRVVFDKKGNWVYTILNYQEKDLPAYIRLQVKNSFADFYITLVQEVTQGNIKLYKIHLESETKLKQILVYEGEITEYQEYNRAR